MRRLLASLMLTASLALVGCAAPPAPRAGPPAPETLFVDRLFGAPSERVGAQDIFALTDRMRRYAHEDMAGQIRKLGPQGALVESLYRKGKLKLEYDSAVTWNAAQAFEARSGNCLSLVIMTAAFAKELGLRVQYQSAFLEESWSRKGDLLLKSGHLNLTLGMRIGDARTYAVPQSVTIDFLPPEELRNLKTREVPESLVVAMYMNNRAVEALAQGRLDDAYAWARESVRTEPRFLAAQNTLGVVYMRRGALAESSAVFNHVLAADPDHTRALGNLIEVRTREGRVAEAAQLRQRLARLEPEPPLHFFSLGLAAMKRGDYRDARDLFAREAARGDTVAEVHFWLGVAHYQLGDVAQATRELGLAADASASRSERELYSAKLEWLRARGMR